MINLQTVMRQPKCDETAFSLYTFIRKTLTKAVALFVGAVKEDRNAASHQQLAAEESDETA